MMRSANYHRKWIVRLLAMPALLVPAVVCAQPAPQELPPDAQPAAAPDTQPPVAPANPKRSTAPAERPPLIHLVDQTPPPPPPVARTDKSHDGFYVRVNLGFGSQSTSLDSGSAWPNYSGTAGTLNLGLLLCGAPSPGIVLGGGLLFDNMPSTSLDASDGYTLKTSTSLATFGPFIDGYPNPRGGFHLGGTVGFSTLGLSNARGLASNRTNGFGLAAWLGYDWWVADQWSVGGLLQFSGSHTTHSATGADLSVDTRSVALMLTAVYQ